jgi:hypothetical protein
METLMLNIADHFAVSLSDSITQGCGSRFDGFVGPYH